jgi:hypothetical protein
MRIIKIIVTKKALIKLDVDIQLLQCNIFPDRHDLINGNRIA